MTALAPAPAPGPRGRLVLGSLHEMRTYPLRFLTESARRFGDVVRIDLVERVHLLVHPDHVKHVLKERSGSYRKGFLYERLKVLIGDGLLASNGDLWLRQRRIAAPAFHRDVLAKLQHTMVRRTGEMLDRWARFVDDARSFNVAQEMTRLTLGIAGETLCGKNLLEEAEGVGRAASTVLEILNRRMHSLVVLPSAIPTPENRRLARAVDVLDDVVRGVIADRRRGRVQSDLLQLLLDAEDAETGERMSDAQVRDEVMTLLLAGYETTAQALSWTWYLLGEHPDVARAVAREVSDVLGGALPGPADLSRLPLVEAAVKEALRLFPPAWLFSRTAAIDDVIGGHPIPRGSTVLLCPWVTQRDARFWDDPDAFRPERFAPDHGTARERFAYFPFAAGPRMCIGWHFAMMELVTVVACVLQRVRLDLVPGRTPVPEATITLRPGGGVHVVARPA